MNTITKFYINTFILYKTECQMTYKLELMSLWIGSILAAVTSHSIPVVLSCLASVSVIIAHREQVVKFIKDIFKKK
jgi:hypothetical protein